MRVQPLDFASFAEAIRGTVTYPTDPRYDDLRKPWLQVVDQHPAVIVEAATVDDVVASVDLARERGLPLGVMSTGHGIAAACDGGVLLRLSKLKRIDVDVERRTVRIEPGVTARELLAATQKHGLSYPAGQVSSVGTVGYTLGGGMGWLVRKLGAAADRVIAADVVLADGSRVRATADENSDLLWALRGGGGNFGIVTSLEAELSSIVNVVGGELYYPLERAGEILRFYRTWSSGLGDDTSTILRLLAVPPIDDLPASIRGKTCCMIGLAHANPDTADAVLAPFETLGDAYTGEKYYNFFRGDEQALVPHAFDAETFGRLREIKRVYDPANLFRLNLNVTPA